MEKFDGPLSLKHPHKLEWLDENDSQKREEILDANNNVYDDLSWLYRCLLYHIMNLIAQYYL